VHGELLDRHVIAEVQHHHVAQGADAVETLWRRLVFEWPGAIGIQHAHETAVRDYELRLAPGPYRYTLCCDPEQKASISFKQIEPDVLALEGIVDGKPIRGRFRRMDESRFPLLSHGFHWISEGAFDR
jgi:hypothetical protein